MHAPRAQIELLGQSEEVVHWIGIEPSIIAHTGFISTVLIHITGMRWLSLSVSPACNASHRDHGTAVIGTDLIGEAVEVAPTRLVAHHVRGRPVAEAAGGTKAVASCT